MDIVMKADYLRKQKNRSSPEREAVSLYLLCPRIRLRHGGAHAKKAILKLKFNSLRQRQTV